MTISRLSSWKDLFIQSDKFYHLDSKIKQLKNLIEPASDISKSMDKVSKNPGICLLSLDPTESKLQLFHYTTTIGGSWDNPKKRVTTFVDFNFDAHPMAIVSKSIREVRAKSHSIHEFSLCCTSEDDFNQLRNPKLTINFKNIIPIPPFLTKVFLNLPSTDLASVAVAFFNAIYKFEHEFHESTKTKDNEDLPPSDDKLEGTQSPHHSLLNEEFEKPEKSDMGFGSEFS